MWKKYKTYIISILIALGVGGLSALLTSNNMNLYNEIITPPLSPPSILFPIVWTILYVLMGISSAMIYNQKEDYPKEVRNALKVYAINLFLNFTWSIIFFNFKAYFFAFIWLLLLWATILTMIVKFYNIKPTAGYLQIPYLLWVTFAGYLNLSIFLLNKM
ncbi:MAG: tryptophan-rich sensory protein [Clostridia bacterium]|nr:tryptophan-rich sensory protein [Clostridia bacterium]